MTRTRGLRSDSHESESISDRTSTHSNRCHAQERPWKAPGHGAFSGLGADSRKRRGRRAYRCSAHRGITRQDSRVGTFAQRPIRRRNRKRVRRNSRPTALVGCPRSGSSPSSPNHCTIVYRVCSGIECRHRHVGDSCSASRRTGEGTHREGHRGLRAVCAGVDPLGGWKRGDCRSEKASIDAGARTIAGEGFRSGHDPRAGRRYSTRS